MSTLSDETRWMDAVDQAALVAKGEVTPAELLEAAIERMEAIDPTVHALTITWFDHAREIAAGPDLPAGPFHGVPFLLKDLYTSFAGQTVSNGCVALRDAAIVDTTDTTLVARYKAAGLVIAGRTNSPEMGSLPCTQPIAWGPTHNPWDLERTPGGSSGGAAAAVASGMVPFANASDGGGSIRIPASACGLVGLKPSQGRTSLGPVARRGQPQRRALRQPHRARQRRAPRRRARPRHRRHRDRPGARRGPTPTRWAPIPAACASGCSTCTRRAACCTTIASPPCAPRRRCSRGSATTSRRRGRRRSPTRRMSQKFMAMWSTNMAMGRAGFAATLGRDVTEADIEPVNWIQAEFAAGMSAVDYAAALAASYRFRRDVQAWWADGWDLLLTPTLAEPPPTLAEFEPVPGDPRRRCASPAAGSRTRRRST